MNTDQQIDTLVHTLSDTSPNRAIYADYITKLGYHNIIEKAVELKNSPTIRKPAAVFFVWAKKQVLLKPQTSDVIPKTINETDPLHGFDEAVAAL